MSKDVRRVNAFFRDALKSDVESVKGIILLSERQEKIFDMYYVKKQDVGFIADTLNVCNVVISTELKRIRDKVVRVI